MRLQPCTRFSATSYELTEKSRRFINYVIDSFYHPFEKIDLDISVGATKAVVLNANDNYVLKFPFNGWYNYEKWRNFKGAVGEEKWNYCEAELLLYEEIPSEFQCLFAEIEAVSYDDIVFYKQDKVIPYVNDCECRTDRKVSDEVNNSNYTHLEEEWLAVVEEYYGTDFTIEFLNWLFTSDITDLHDENYGYSEKDGRPLIFDWGGYNG